MITFEQIQEHAMSQWGKLAAFGIAILFGLLILIKLISGITFFFKGNANSKQTQNTTQAQSEKTIDLTRYHLFGMYTPKNLDPNQLPKATLDLTLNGVFLAVPEKYSQAVLTAPGENQKVYNVGDDLPEGAKLYQVLNNSVIILYNGQLQQLLLPEPKVKFKNKKPDSLDLPKINP